MTTTTFRTIAVKLLVSYYTHNGRVRITTCLFFLVMEVMLVGRLGHGCIGVLGIPPVI